MVREMARSRIATTSSLVRPFASFQRVSAWTCASRTCGDDTGGALGPGRAAGWPRDSHSASYTASMALPTSEPGPCPEPARTRAPTRQTALTDSGLQAPATSPLTIVRCPPPGDTDHQPPCTHPASSSSRAASSKASSCSRLARRNSFTGCRGRDRIRRRRHQGRPGRGDGSRPGVAVTAAAGTAAMLASGRCPAGAIVEVVISPGSLRLPGGARGYAHEIRPQPAGHVSWVDVIRRPNVGRSQAGLAA